MLIRSCPECNIEIIYENNRKFRNAEINNMKCGFCRLNRFCPQCNGIITYQTTIAKNKGTKGNNVCHKCCIGKNREFNNRPEIKELISERMKIFANTPEQKKILSLNGKNNIGNKYWLGRKMSPEHLEKHRKKCKEMWKDPNCKLNSKEHRENLSSITKGSNNPMFGKSVYDIWVEKYGIEEANKKQIEINIKQSINTKGSNNPMFGKEPPKGTGIGISGWYKGWYFRSSLELSYMIRIIERFKLKWRTAEAKDLSITYEMDGIQKNYKADFLINEKYLLEIKPKKMWKWKQNFLKAEAGKKFCSGKGYIYKYSDPGNFTSNEMLEMHYMGIIKIEDNKLKKLLRQS